VAVDIGGFAVVVGATVVVDLVMLRDTLIDECRDPVDHRVNPRAA